MSTALPKLYVAGPMTGLPEFNYPAFDAAAAALRQAGYQVVNPAEDGLPLDAPYEHHLRLAIARLMGCQAVATLPGWRHSKGAKLEVHNALEVGMRVAPVELWLF